TILLSSHLLHQVQAVCDRVAIFVKGKVVAQGAPHQLAADSKVPEEVEVQVGADEAAVRSALAGQKFLRSITPGRIPRTFLIEVERGNTNRLVARLVEVGFPITSVRRVSEDLDEVYRRYFHAEEVKTGG
ncbi:MAG: ABC transporter ATP-binding protein, partial [Acidimicrobiia bacterium]